MTLDFKELHLSRLRNHPPSLRSISFSTGPAVDYYDHPGLEIGSVLWTGGSVLSQFLIDTPTLVTAKRVLELGSGLGITGIVAARYAEAVHLTDKSELIPLIRSNISRNQCSNAVAFEYVWGDPPTAGMADDYDVILGADVLYSEAGYPGLKRTILAMRKVGGSVVFAYKVRGLGETRFIEELKKEFNDWSAVEIGEVHIARFA